MQKRIYILVFNGFYYFNGILTWQDILAWIFFSK